MLKSRKSEILAAIVLAGPFVALYAWMFVYPTIQMVHLSFMKAPLIGEGTWTGLKNYVKLFSDRTFRTAVWNTAYFVLLTVIPGTAVALAIALMVSRLNGWFQSIILAMFFIPYVLPVTVVYILWDWLLNVQFGVLQPIISLFAGGPVNVWRTIPWFMPGVAVVTIWWTNGFSILLCLAGIRAIPKEIYEAAALDGASRWQV
ncbi:MAG: sugar ABC transporter permease, partial [Rhizobiales bacterium]|nr:sugar ABC transporter permease [Hyphomicrobiales bacterium]